VINLLDLIVFPFISMCGTIPAYVTITVVQKLFAFAPISHPCPVRWGQFPVLEIAGAIKKEIGNETK
jgi:hypothetical protein